MSIAVGLDDLVDVVAGFGFAYLVTVSDKGRLHVVAVTPVVASDRLRIADVGRTTMANVTAWGAVTLVWPPADIHQHSLIVDGTGRVDGDGVVVIPKRAVLHRPAPAPAASAARCGSDWVEIPIVAPTAQAPAGGSRDK